MSENENKDQADELRKEIAYLSGLIKSAKTKSNFHEVSSVRTSINNFHVHSRSQYHQQSNFVPFPKSSKYIAPSVLSKTSTGKNEFINNHQKSTKYIASKGNLSKSVSYPVLSNSKSVQNKDVPQCFHGASSSMFQKHPNQDPSKFSERLHSSNFDHETKSSSKKNLEFKEVEKVKVHVNPKFLKPIPNSSCASTSNMPVVKLSDTMSHSVNIGSKVVPKATEKSFNSLRHSSKNIESQILALRKSLGYEVPPVTNSLTVPNANKKNWVHKFTGNESALQPNHPDIQKQIINLRKTLGYEIPSVLPIDNTEEQIRKLRASLGYELHDDDNRKIKESNSSKISKSQSDFYHYSPTAVKSLSPYKIDKSRNFKTNSASAKLKLSFTRDQFQQPNTRSWTSKYVLNRKKTTKKLSPKIIKSRFKYIVKSQIKDTPMKMSASSTTQRAAKTIVSKYKIRKIPEVKKSKLLYNQTVDPTSYNLKCPRRKSWQDQDRKLPKFSSAYKWSSKSKNDSEANIYSWRRLSQSCLNSYRSRPCINQLNKSSINHLNILKGNQRYKTDRRSSCNSNLVFINGFLYKTTGNSILRTGSKNVDNRKNRSSLLSWNKNKSSCIIIKKINGKETKTVQVRGVTFEMASNGHSLKRIDTGTGERKSPEKRNRVTRIDLHGITYIQTKPGTLVKMDTLRTRTVTSRVINKSITTIITNKQRKKVNKQYCIYFNRFGKCNRGNLCQFLHDPDKVAVCTRFLRGTCKVKDCLFSHQVSEDKMPVCSYFLKGRCDKDDCPYLHVKVSQNAAICLSFINGYCPNGKECKKLHSRICPEFSKTGKCKSGKRCQLEHKRKNAIKRKNSRSGKETSTIATKDIATVEESTTPANKLPSYISLVEYSSPYIPPNTNKGYSDTPLDQDESLHIKPRL